MLNKLHHPFRISSRSGFIAWLPHKGGFDYHEPDIPVKDRLKMVAKALPEETRKWGREWKQACTKDLSERIRPVDHDELRIEWQFNDPKLIQDFTVTADSDWNRGYSTAEFVPTKQNTALFKGFLDPTCPPDGITHRAGITNISSPWKKRSFYRDDCYEDWICFSHLTLKVRGDGRTYLLVLSTPGSIDVTWHDVFSYPLFTHGGPYWQYVKIPFSKFYFQTHGRIQDRQWPLWAAKVSRIGITLCDRRKGPFALEVDWIGVYKDITHTEEFAYENYNLTYHSSP